MSSQTFCMSTNFLLTVFSATLAVSTSASSLDQNTTQNVSQIFKDWIVSHIFENWIKEQNRVYSNSEEKARRFEIFKANYLEVQKYNEEQGLPYTKGFNIFSDMTAAEFRSKFGCCCSSVDQDVATPSFKMLSYYSVAAVEAATRVTNGPDIPLEKLSVQQILDRAFGDRCEGGSVINAYAYIMKNGGLASNRTYWYTDMNIGTCDETRARNVVGGSIMGFMRLLPPDEEVLEEAICRGPVTSNIASNSPAFSFLV